MWTFGRLLARAGVARRSSTSGRPNADLPTYARWLNGALAQLAQALLWTTPLATLGASTNQVAIPHHLDRVRAARVELLDLLEAADQHQPPARLEPAIGTLPHQRYVDVVERSIAALDVLEQGLATTDEGAVRLVSAQLRELASTAADVHAQVIQWALPFLIGPD